MSKANSTVKVLQTALKRIEKGRWGQGTWMQEGKNLVTGESTHLLCLEGSITNGHNQPMSEQQEEALNIMRSVMKDWHGRADIPGGNDHGRFTYAMAIEIAKESLRRAKGEKADTAQRTGPSMEDLFNTAPAVEDCKIPDAFEELIQASGTEEMIEA